MNGKDILELGYPKGPIVGKALACAEALSKLEDDRIVKHVIAHVLKEPELFAKDEGSLCKELADSLLEGQKEADEVEELVKDSVMKPYRTWGYDGIEPQAIEQMDLAMQLPIVAAGALMPDAHWGMGICIGGVLACRNAVIVNCVGVDIACRMRLSILDIVPEHITTNKEHLVNAIEKETRFGIGAKFTRSGRRKHDVMDDSTWYEIPFMTPLKDKAWEQLGTSGGGNHFYLFGVINILKPIGDLKPGRYLAMMSHSGSRGPGAIAANHYQKIATAKLPKRLEKFKALAWLSLDSAEGQEYWQAMNLMGRFAAANHEVMHRQIAKRIGAQVVASFENHHNFAWKETHKGEELIVHRKGATPAGKETFGIIPGSMATSCYLVKGKGNEDSLMSASHGAGRLMSRTAAKQKFIWSVEKKKLEKKGVHVISCGVDEVPGVYKDIEKIMLSQADLVEVLGCFQPKIVKMSPGGRAED